MLRAVTIYPENLKDLSLIDIQIVGSNQIGSRAMQVQALTQMAQIYMPTGRLNIDEAIKQHARLLGIKGGDKLIMQGDSAAAQGGLYNLLAGLGQGGMKFANPASLAALTPPAQGSLPAPAQQQPMGQGGAMMMPGAPGMAGQGAGMNMMGANG